MKNSSALAPLCSVVVLIGAITSTQVGSCMSVTDGLALWLKADSITGVAPGGAVSVWPDSSGNGLDVAQTDPGLQPKWEPNAAQGKPAVYFDDQDFLYRDDVIGSSLTSEANATVFLVMYQMPGDTYASAFGWVNNPSNNRFLCHALWGDIVTVQHGLPSDAQVWYPADWRGRWHSFFWRRDGALIQAQLDGVWLQEGNRQERPAPSVSARLYVGSDVFSNYLWGYIAEILIYRRTLSDAEAQAVSEYLNQKWVARPATRIVLSGGQSRLLLTNLTPGSSYFVQRAFTLYPPDGWTTVAQFDSPAEQFEWGELLEQAWRVVFYRIGYALEM